MTIEHPLVLGLAGKAGSGKTSVASALAPLAQVINPQDPPPVIWTHLSLATPIKRIATTRQKITGDNAWSRQCYETHEVISSLFRNILTYDEVVDLVYEVMNLPIEPSGKPRSFLQYLATDLFRKIDPDVFVKALKRSIMDEFRYLLVEYGEDQDIGIVIDDVRFNNECEFIHSLPRGYLVRFDVSPEVARERLLKRDGFTTSEAESEHVSETELESVAAELFNGIINTDDLSIRQQCAETLDVLDLKGDMYLALKQG